MLATQKKGEWWCKKPEWVKQSKIKKPTFKFKTKNKAATFNLCIRATSGDSSCGQWPTFGNLIVGDRVGIFKLVTLPYPTRHLINSCGFGTFTVNTFGPFKSKQLHQVLHDFELFQAHDAWQRRPGISLSPAHLVENLNFTIKTSERIKSTTMKYKARFDGFMEEHWNGNNRNIDLNFSC